MNTDLLFMYCIMNRIILQIKKAPSCEEAFFYFKNISYLFLIAACAAAKRAIGTRNGEQDT